MYAYMDELSFADDPDLCSIGGCCRLDPAQHDQKCKKRKDFLRLRLRRVPDQRQLPFEVIPNGRYKKWRKNEVC